MEAKIHSLISKMELSRARLTTILEKVTPQVEIYPTWKLKQVIDHIAAWDELVVTTLSSYLHGESPALAVNNGINQFNAESVSARKDLPMEESRAAYDLARNHVLHALREIPPEMLDQDFPAPWGGMCTIHSIVKIFVSHELEHAKQIEEILNKPTVSV